MLESFQIESLFPQKQALALSLLVDLSAARLAPVVGASQVITPLHEALGQLGPDEPASG